MCINVSWVFHFRVFCSSCRPISTGSVLRSSSLIILLFIPASASMEGCPSLPLEQLLARRLCHCTVWQVSVAGRRFVPLTHRALLTETVVVSSALLNSWWCLMGSSLQKQGYASLKGTFTMRHGQTQLQDVNLWEPLFSLHTFLSYSSTGQGLLV